MSEAPDTPQHNGLVRWRKAIAADRKAKIEALVKLREQATTEIYEGREYKLVRIPDRYGEPAPPSPAPVISKRRRSGGDSHAY